MGTGKRPEVGGGSEKRPEAGGGAGKASNTGASKEDDQLSGPLLPCKVQLR